MKTSVPYDFSRTYIHIKESWCKYHHYHHIYTNAFANYHIHPRTHRHPPPSEPPHHPRPETNLPKSTSRPGKNYGSIRHNIDLSYRMRVTFRLLHGKPPKIITKISFFQPLVPITPTHPLSRPSRPVQSTPETTQARSNFRSLPKLWPKNRASTNFWWVRVETVHISIIFQFLGEVRVGSGLRFRPVCSSSFFPLRRHARRVNCQKYSNPTVRIHVS